MSDRRTRHRTIPIIALALAVLAPDPANAQEPADTFDLPEIVVTANRVPRHRDLIPAPVTVITRETIETRGLRTVAEALRTVPGMAISRAGSLGAQTSAFLRGGESNYLQVLIDGIEANDPGGSFDFADLSTDNIERIEIVRGPTSVLYGSDAVTGVVQIFTRRGDGPPSVTAELRGGIGDERLGDGDFRTLDIDASIAGGSAVVQYAAGFARFDTDGLLPFNNDYTRNVVSGRLAVTPDAATDVRLTARFTDAEYHFPTDGAGNLVDTNAFSARDALTLGLEAGRRLSDRFEGRLLLGLHATDRAIDDDFDDAEDASAFQSTAELLRQSVDARLNTYLGPAVLTVGGEVEREAVEGRSVSTSSFGEFEGATDEERSNRAGYGQLIATIANRLSVTAGARIEDNDEFGTFDTYRGGVSYIAPSGTRARFVAGTAFREPGFDENFGSGFGDRGNPTLDPERSTSWEVGLEQELFGGRVRLEATYFDQDFNDLIQFTFSPPDPEDPNYFNVGSAQARGVELGTELEPAPGLHLSGGATYTETEVTDPGLATDFSFVEGEPLLRRPGWTANAAVRWVLPTATVGASLEHFGRRDDLDFSTGAFPAPRIELPARQTVDLFGELRIARGTGAGLTALLRVENVFDETFQEINGFPAPGRTVSLGLRLGLGGGR